VRTFSGLTSRRPFTLLGLVLAIVVIAAFVLVALNAQNATSNPTIRVVVTTKDLEPRVPIASSSLMLASISVPTDYQKVFFTRVADVNGMIPLVGIGQGQAITANDVARPNAALGPQSEFLPIPTGYVALTIPTSEQQGVAGYVQPDDYISVIASVSLGTHVATKTIFTNLHVIKVGEAGSNNSPTSFTVVVTQCQAEVITWFLGYASLKYSLESYHDYLSSTAQSPDPACPSVNSAKGVTLQAMQAAYPTLF
jgi:Flp pilus assembly protein CpaB